MVKLSFAERGGFEPPKPFWSLHAFQACLFNHSSISPSSQLACKKKLACEFGLPPLLLLTRAHKALVIIYILEPTRLSDGFHDYRNALVA